MKNELTVNALAFGNLKQHKKQYTVMIIGIILAMVFSSSVIFMLSAMRNSVTEIKNERFGKQSVMWANMTENDVEKAKENKVIGKAGYAHVLGALESTDEKFSDAAALAWLDDTALELANPNVLEGRMPEAENEIAVEKIMLSKLGISANVGDNVTFNLKTQDGAETLDNAHQVTYKLVGILENKVNYISFDSGIKADHVPTAFVCKNTAIEAGGKETLVCYARYYSDKDTTRDKEKMVNYLDSVGRNDSWNFGWYSNSNFNMMFDSAVSNAQSQIIFAVIIIAVLMIASCLVIVNSFNSNLEERKKQIGMFRAIGATKKQIRKIYAREAVIISLISAPASCLVSLFLVKTIIKFMGDNFAFKLNWWVVLISLLFCVLCVMISAVIPLISASRITPIQAIRNIENTRMLNKKHIKSKKEFDVPRLIASRSLTFGKGKQAAVSIILIIVVICSGYVFSSYDYISKNPGDLGADYQLYMSTHGYDSFVNYNNVGFTESDRQFIENNKYISESRGKKVRSAQMIVPVDNSEYRKCLSSINFWSNMYSREVKKTPGKTDNYEVVFSKNDDYNIKKIREKLNVGEFMPSGIISYDTKYLESLKQYVYDGEINIDKINSGEEIILYAPSKVGFAGYRETLSGRSYNNVLNEDVDKKDCFFKADCDFHAGDEIEISVITEGSPYDQKEEANVSGDAKITRKKVKIGALINDAPNEYLPYFEYLRVITSTSAMNSLMPNLKYLALDFYLNTSCTDEVDKAVMEELKEVSSKVNQSGFGSNYGFVREQKELADQIFIASMAIVILFFVISVSIINNTITASIRNNKTKIGTLRAVGADEKSLVKSYIYQLLSMLLWGSGIGLSGFFASYGIAYLIHIADNAINGITTPWNMTCNPTIAIIFVVLAFLICSINLWLKIRQEMKNSIVENIREL